MDSLVPLAPYADKALSFGPDMHTKLVVARYLLGLLHSRSPSFFDTHKPISFSTLSSPVSLIRNRIIPYTDAHTARCLQHYGIPRYSESLFSAPPRLFTQCQKTPSSRQPFAGSAHVSCPDRANSYTSSTSIQRMIRDRCWRLWLIPVRHTPGPGRTRLAES